MKLVLIAVLLQLCLSVLDVSAGAGGAAAGGGVGELVPEDQLQFGDLLVFTEKSYHHYAVYVDNEDVGQEVGQNIFEMTKRPKGCHFRHYQGPFRRHNYLDPGIAQGREPMQPQNQQQMIATIQSLMQDPVCQTYDLLRGNCEQIATFVRYNESHCIQEGAKKRIRAFANLLLSGSVHLREAAAAA